MFTVHDVGRSARHGFPSTPDAVAKDESLRSNLSASAGVRTYFKVASNGMFGPAVSIGTGLAGAITGRGYSMVQVDIPVVFREPRQRPSIEPD